MDYLSEIVLNQKSLNLLFYVDLINMSASSACGFYMYGVILSTRCKSRKLQRDLLGVQSSERNRILFVIALSEMLVTRPLSPLSYQQLYLYCIYLIYWE